ncbi:hypothetical protein BJV82DRAFT_592261 [Fennellomyces sp. T-0311]|nr:hypothetical protein BJV82DRAFT_592261 [Fennellomyces sp. T-0311]
MAALALKRRTPSLGTLPNVPNISVMENPMPPTPAASINSKPTTGSSLYHTCRSVCDKLSCVDGMEDYLVDAEPISSSSPSSSEPTTPTASDPLTKLWTICRRGAPLCTLFNAMNPEKPLKVDRNPSLNHLNTCKASVYHFIVACRDQLKFTEDELFTITDLYQDDTNGFVKVVNTVDKLLCLLEKDGVITVRSSNRNSDPNAPKDTRDKVVQEMLETERKYVQDLETLQNYMRELQAQKILSPDTVHYLFGNLNTLVDFQRRFLIQLENAAENSPEEQRFCHLFLQMEDAFAVYEPYCANYYSAQDLVVQETPKLQKLADILNPNYELPSLLIKPVQRICKYPLLLGQLIKTTNKDWPHYAEMEDGLEAIKRVTEKVNETRRKHENLQAVEDLRKRVDESQRDLVEGHGNLLLQNKLMMLSGDSERELQMFLFEKALLICKETKDASKNRLTKTNTLSIKKKRRASLQAKGRIFTNRIISVTNKSQPGTWALVIEFKDRDIERFTLKFRLEEHIKLWESTLNKIKAQHKTHVPNTHLVSMSTPMTPANSQSRNEGSYFVDDDDEEDDEDEEEDDFQTARSRSNSVSAQQMLGMRPKMPRQNSQDASMWKATNGRHQPMPGMNLSPLPRPSNAGLPSSPPVDYGVYPASPPPSSPSSPANSSRTSTGTSSSWHRQRDADASPLADIASKFMSVTDAITPSSEEYRPLGAPPGRSQSHSAGSYAPSGPPPPMPSASSPRSHTRVRSQSSPNIHKNTPMQQWDELPQVPINSRTLYRDQNSNGVRNVSSTPRLSEMATSPSLQSQIDRVVSAVPNSPGTVKIKLSYCDGIYVIMVPQEVTYVELMEKVEKKIRLVASLKPSDMLRIRYQDEDGDLITINSDDDVLMAFENRGNNTALNLFVSV